MLEADELRICFDCECGEVTYGSVLDLSCKLTGSEVAWEGITCERCDKVQRVWPIETHETDVAFEVLYSKLANTVDALLKEQRLLLGSMIDIPWKKTHADEIEHLEKIYWLHDTADGMRLEFWPAMDQFRYNPVDKWKTGLERRDGGIRFIKALKLLEAK
jgi:hypothetical protein